VVHESELMPVQTFVKSIVETLMWDFHDRRRLLFLAPIPLKCDLHDTLGAVEIQEDSKMPTPHTPSAGVRRALRKLGSDIHDARRRRRLTMAVIAERAFTSRATLQRVEAGDPGVSIGIYAAVLQALGLLDGLLKVADAAQDTVGQALATAALPQRVRLRRSGGSGDHG
jgi:hypothetical protein